MRRWNPINKLASQPIRGDETQSKPINKLTSQPIHQLIIFFAVYSYYKEGSLRVHWGFRGLYLIEPPFNPHSTPFQFSPYSEWMDIKCRPVGDRKKAGFKQPGFESLEFNFRTDNAENRCPRGSWILNKKLNKRDKMYNNH